MMAGFLIHLSIACVAVAFVSGLQGLGLVIINTAIAAVHLHHALGRD